MRIYILTDMEEISGIWCSEQVQRGNPEYELGRTLLCEDVNAAIAGAFEGDITHVVVLDGHGGGPHLILDRMDPRAVYETIRSPRNPLPSLNESFNGLMLVGAHAMAGTLNGFLDHTRSSISWFNFYLNGKRCGEIGQAGAYAGAFGVPVFLVTGDKAACDEASKIFGDIELISVKEGLGRNRARCISPERAHEMIRESARKAVQRAKEIIPWILEPPIEMGLELCRSDYADELSNRPGVERIDTRTVRKFIRSAKEVYWW